jgi:YggT family protein
MGECGHLRRARDAVKDRAFYVTARQASLEKRSALVLPAMNRYIVQHQHPSEHRLMRALLDVILVVLQVYVWILIAAAVLSWLVAFNVVNTRNQVVAMLGDFLWRITEPALRPIRAVLPNLGGIDISPVILILIIFLIENIIIRYIYPNVF